MMSTHSQAQNRTQNNNGSQNLLHKWANTHEKEQSEQASKEQPEEEKNVSVPC